MESTTAAPGNGPTYKVYGTVRDIYQQTMPGVTVRAYYEGISGRTLLAETVTAADGTYTISYALENSSTAALLAAAYDAKNNLLKESGVYYEVPDELQVDIDLSDKPFAGTAKYDQLLGTLAPFTSEVPLAKMTETADTSNINFIVQKTGLARQAVEMMAMAARFETLSSLPARVWFGILAQDLPSPLNWTLAAPISPLGDFETRLTRTFDMLMHRPVSVLNECLQKSINENKIAYAVSADLEKISQQLSDQLLAYAKQHPVTGAPSLLHQNAALGGLKGEELQSFIKLKNNHADTEGNFWEKAQETPALKSTKKLDMVQAVFHVSKLTGNNQALTENLVKTQKIKSVAHVKELAGNTRHDWAAMLKKHKIAPNATIPGKTDEEKVQNYAAELDANFTREYPTASFAARLEKDAKSKLPHKDKVSKFLEKNQDFDLLNHHVGTFIKSNPKAVPEKDADDVMHHVRRIQRVMKLTPAYDNASVLLNDNIHSAQQVYKMGKDNFVNTYIGKLSQGEAEQVFQKAEAVHANAVALASNLRSMSDASALNAFPDFSTTISQQLSNDLPDLDTLFGHTDYCDCSECNSVYGAPAYLTDILHYLDKRNTLLPVNAGKVPSVKDILMTRRPDLGDINLECNNTNTVVPYIDIACELMEDYIAPPVIILASSFLTSLVKGTISASLLTALKAQFTATGQANISNLLSAAATISDPYNVKHLQPDGTYLPQTHWVLRDTQMTLRATNTTSTGTIEFRVLHQTLLPAEAINAGPEYINTNVYTTFLKTAKKPFALPFDLFETEGELYLEKLGVTKADLIDTFRKEDKALPGASVTDLKIGYASLGINEAEQALIFVADTTHQSLYWGAFATTTAIQVDVFEKLTRLTYRQVTDLLQLQFINPAKDTVIEHDDLSSDRTRQRVINLTPVKLDAIHRFLRLWRKTALTMGELDAIIMAPLIGAGKILNKLAMQLHQFLILQQKLNVSAFQLLAFYQNIDTTHNLPDCLYNEMFQNSAVTSPVSANFSIAAATPGTLSIAEADKAVIAAVLQVSVSDVNALIAKTVSRISFPALSVMYRNAQLAQSLNLSAVDLLKLLALVDADPFQNLQATSLFIQKYQLLQTSGFSIDELNYILRHQDNDSQSMVPSAGQVSTALSQLQDEFLVIRAATQPAADANGALLIKWLSDSLFKWDAGQILRLVDILSTVDDTNYQQKLTDNDNFLLNLRMVYHDAVLTADLPALPAAVILPAQLTYDTDKKLLKLAGYMSPADKTVLLALSTDSAYQAAINALFTAAQQTDSSAANTFFATTADINTSLKTLLSGNTAARFAFFINKLSPVYKQLQQQNALVTDISTWFKTDKRVIAQLLVSLPGIYTDLTDDSFVTKAVGVNNPAQVSRYQFVAKVCFIATRLNLTDADLAFLLAHAADVNSLNFLTLPLAPVAAPVTTFSSFDAFINLLRFQQYYPVKIIDTVNNTTLSIYTILADAITQGTLTGAALTTYTANLVTNLSLLTGWNPADLTSFIGLPTAGITLTLPADIKSVPILMRLHRRFVVLNQLGIAAADGFAWAKDSLLAADTAKIKQVLKQNYSNSDWLQVTQPLQDTLREKKRDALIAYLLANPGTQTWKNENDLYSYFLLDVEMCSCQPTSRIVQATNSVQLFVQRCFLSIEDSILVDSKADSAWLQWQWMKNFRVWQANVKVFLYPENYIEPELLPVDVKSPFLSELENDLLQGEVTAGNVETAFQSYLLKLRDIARLDIKGQYYDEHSATLHVIAATYDGDPKVYYYRKLVEGRRWTPWQKIDLDINSDYVLPVVYNNHVYLFWAIIKSTDSAAQIKQWQIQLAFSELSNGRWTAKKISGGDDSGTILLDHGAYPVMSSFFFAPLDMPLLDYSTLIGPDGKFIGTPDKYIPIIKKAVIKNGTLLISCFYFDSTIDPATGNPNKYVASFELDAVKGYPKKVIVPTIPILTGAKLLTQGSYQPTDNRRNLVNMYDVEPTDPGVPIIPGVNIAMPAQSRGRYKKLSPFQMGIQDKVTLLVFLGMGPFSSPSPMARTSIRLPFFYIDQHRTYYAPILWTDTRLPDFTFSYEEFYKGYIQGLDNNLFYNPESPLGQSLSIVPTYRLFNFFHPQIGYFMERMFIDGIDGLMDKQTQLKGDAIYDESTDKFDFNKYYSDKPLLPIPGPSNAWLPIEEVDFSLQSGYGLYNWELFFHVPLMIAERLSQNQQFNDAERWYRYIFNPMDTSSYSSPNKFWNTKPFFKTTNQGYTDEQIGNVLKGINGGQQDLVQDVTDWRNNPFQPHFIAAYRTVAYQKVAVMKYVGHLIRHGDSLFSQHTTESVNEATQLYILAAEILGPKPEVIPSVAKTAVDNFYQLEQKLDSMSDALVNVENLVPLQTIRGYTGTPPSGPALPVLQSLYFCAPMNENMAGPTGYWDTVADRLFKIRHCLNIDGTVALLSLFSPIIDPGMLVRATAAGLDIGSILSDMNAPLPFYRFTQMMQKATELVNEVKSLGGLMLSVLEKKDAEAMSLLRSGQEIKIQNAALLIKQKQIDDAQSTLDNLSKQKELIDVRRTYYLGLIKEGLSGGEIAALALNGVSTAIDIGIALSYLFAAGAATFPTIIAGGAGISSPVALVAEGGQNVASGADSLGRNLGAIAAGLDKAAALIGTNAGYDRRAGEWQYQVDLADKELQQIQKQIEGAQIRLEINEQDVTNQQLLIDQAHETDDFMHSKFTNEELFNWMVTQTSSTYFKSYQLAYDIAKQTERSFRYELGLGDSSYINFGYWDSLKKGLLAGEQLSYDLKKMEIAYIELNKRELELTKPISLSQLDPVALLKLKTTGECWMNLPEELFDMDYPGHYMRRIKSVSLTIPCISGPYTTVSCKLTMTNNSVRTSSLAPSDPAQYPRKAANGLPADDPRFRDAVGALQSIATSSAQNDAGLFELNFRDERYLPFEGSGAISLWHMELPAAVRQFDYNTISDVIIHLKYTARDGGDLLKNSAKTNLTARINQMLISTKDKGLARIFSAKNDLPNEWYRFLNPVNAADDQVLTLNLDQTVFPLFAQGKTIKIKLIELVADSTKAPINGLKVAVGPAAPVTVNLTAKGTYGSLLSVSLAYNNSPGIWTITNPVANARLTDAILKNLVIIVHYEVS